MLKRIFVSACITAALATTAQAETLFRGVLNITKVTASCTNSIGVNNSFTAQFHPADIGNSNFAAINRYDNFYAQSWRLLASGSFTTVFQQVSNVTLGWSDFTPAKPTFIRVTKQFPAAGTLTSTSPWVSLLGQIKNPYGDAGFESCVADFTFIGFVSH